MNYDAVCRCCMEDKLQFVNSIFEENIFHKIKICTDISIEKDDKLPKNICDNCLEELLTSYEFRKKCKKSDITFRQNIYNLENKNNDNSIRGKKGTIQLKSSDDENEELVDDEIPIETVKIEVNFDDYMDEENTLGNQKDENNAQKIFMKDNDILIENIKDDPDGNAGDDNGDDDGDDDDGDGDDDEDDDNEDENNDEDAQSTNSNLKTEKVTEARSMIETQTTKKNKTRTRSQKTTKRGKKSETAKDDNTNKEKKRPIKCEICPKRFLRLVYLNMHIFTYHNNNEIKTLKCDECDKEFSRALALKAHYIGNHLNKKCPHCDKTFPNSNHYDYKKHLKSHSTKKEKYSCNICSKILETRGGYRSHLKRHNGKIELKFRCEYCGKGLESNSGLIKHLRFHTGEKPCECEICHEKFSTTSYLNIHKRKHTGEKPFVCTVCNRSFSRLQYKKDHMYIHDTNAQFPCKFCGIIFNSPKKQRRHQRKHLAPSTIKP